ncbi:MAG: 50S ribosomal protein L29 [Alphaproteobacteria bacterium]|nr:50S ribosomal protein L29 [Alphaproteobacteria bacterium]
MKWQDMKQFDEASLKAKLIEFRKELMGLRFQRVTGEVEKTHQFRIARRSIARIKTLLTQRTKTV